jgi:YydG family peptide modification radical SAM enzyme
MSRQPQNIGLNFDSKGNARCAHCCVNSSPNATDLLTDETVNAVLDDVLSHEDVVEVGLTGGEALLRKEFALSVIRRITDSGRKATCVTNGFWGVTLEAAQKMFSALEDAGLESLTVSYDEFHSPYVTVDRIKNVLDASKSSRIRVILNMAVSRSKLSNELLAALGSSAYCIPVTRFPILPTGQAAKFADGEFFREPITVHNTRCPGLQLIFHNDGRVYPCCSPAVFDTPLTLGSVGRIGLEELIKKVEKNAVLAIVQHEGLLWFRDAIAARFPDAPAATIKSVVSACELCALIFRDPTYVRAIRGDIDDYVTRELVT